MTHASDERSRRRLGALRVAAEDEREHGAVAEGDRAGGRDGGGGGDGDAFFIERFLVFRRLTVGVVRRAIAVSRRALLVRESRALGAARRRARRRDERAQARRRFGGDVLFRAGGRGGKEALGGVPGARPRQRRLQHSLLDAQGPRERRVKRLRDERPDDAQGDFKVARVPVPVPVGGGARVAVRFLQTDFPRQDVAERVHAHLRRERRVPEVQPVRQREPGGRRGDVHGPSLRALLFARERFANVL